MSENPPAFPNTGNSNWNLKPAEGMTLRDWFAGQALASLRTDMSSASPDVFAGALYQLADAMLAVRSKTNA